MISSPCEHDVRNRVTVCSICNFNFHTRKRVLEITQAREEGVCVGQIQELEYWELFFAEWQEVEHEKEQRIAIDWSLECIQKRLKELKGLK